MPKRRIWIWPDAPDRDPPVRLFDGGDVAEWLRYGSKGGSNADSMDATDDASTSDGAAYQEGRILVFELELACRPVP